MEISPDSDKDRNSFAEWQLEAAAYDKADEAIMTFLDAHPAYQRQIDDIRAAERDLATALYRADCPSLRQLQRFVLRELAVPLQRETEAHIKVCSLCRKELAVLNQFV